MSGCLTDEMLIAYAERRLSAEQEADAHLHAEGCGLCRETLRGLGQPDAPLTRPTAWQPPLAFDEFRRLKTLGCGGMGQVHLAYDRILARLVAVKFVDMETPDATTRERFLVEARAIARLSHPNIVSVYRYGQIEGHPYLISEFVRGTPLDQLGPPVPLAQCRQLAIGLARGLGAAHRRGVLHRDIKPSNALVNAEGQVKLLDFGLAKLLDSIQRSTTSQTADRAAPPAPSRAAAEVSLPPQPISLSSITMADSTSGGRQSEWGGSPLTRAGAALGTPAYMSPEAWRGEPASPQSDLYSLGAVLYELCSGSRPHPGSDIATLRVAITSSDPPPLATRVPNIGPAFAAVIDRCLRRDPAERYAATEELLQALEDAEADRKDPGPQRDSSRAGSVGVKLLSVAVLAGIAISAGLSRQPGHSPPPAAAAIIAIPGGEFRMGSTPTEIEAAYAGCQRQTSDPLRDCVLRIFQREQPPHQVRLSPYRIDATEVTLERFAAWLNSQLPRLRVDPDGEHPELLRYVRDGDTLLADVYPTFTPTFGLAYDPQARRFAVVRGFERQPVTHVTWDGAQRYCQGRGMRLPTEAEWERAARAEPGFRFPWGYDEPGCDGVIFDRRQGGACARLGLKLPDVGASPQDRTPQGVADLGGSVSEWVLDRFADRYVSCDPVCQDPVVPGPARGAVERVLRGGDWNGMGVLARSAGRGRYPQDHCAQNLGFRCAAPGR